MERGWNDCQGIQNFHFRSLFAFQKRLWINTISKIIRFRLSYLEIMSLWRNAIEIDTTEKT